MDEEVVVDSGHELSVVLKLERRAGLALLHVRTRRHRLRGQLRQAAADVPQGHWQGGEWSDQQIQPMRERWQTDKESPELSQVRRGCQE